MKSLADLIAADPNIDPALREAIKPLVKVPCGFCPDGYVWNEDGPTDKECFNCRGKAYILVEAQ